MEALVGRWTADSTFTVDDTHASRLKDQGVLLEIFADTSYSQLDTTHLAFQGKSDGEYYLSGDTLIVFPTAAAPDTFLVKLRFLGNYLELDHPADQRFTFFHKVKAQDSATQREMLKDSLWRMQGRRPDPGIFQAEPLDRNFSYLRFSGDSMWADTRLNGIIRLDSGLLEKSGFTWTWKAAGGTRLFIADLVKEDSLRMWPLTDGRPDSGYALYIRTSAHHRNDLDMRPLLGHLRSDSMVYASGTMENHYGRFYDWILGEDHKVGIETNMKTAPLFETWSLDSGFLSLAAPGIPATRFRVDTSGGALKLSADSGKAFGKSLSIYQTRVDPERFRNKPFERFQQASYFQLVVAGDTSDYFFNVNGINDGFEIADVDEDTTLWTSLILNKAQETFQSSQAGFFFALQGRTRTLGGFTCKSAPDKDLVIRLTGAADPLMAQGLVQGACRILSADSTIADSSLTLEGSFRLKRKITGIRASPLWKLQ
ncbi:MAG: hypothetical protein JWO30_4206 [Fibrobacteres bacterium]|nr:hypothetical protein [Fibrobacterota bacterium]